MGFSKRVSILGCPIDNITMSETIGKIHELIKQGGVHQHVVVNVDKLLKLRSDEKLREIISNCDIINADGMPIVWVSGLFGSRIKERVTGIDLMENLIKDASQKGYRPFFFGARKPVVERVVRIYRNKYPKLRIAGSE